MENMCEYWRKELGREFRERAMKYVGGYAESIGKIRVNDDKLTYNATLDLNDSLSTIVPVNISCTSSTRLVRFVSIIKVNGHITRDQSGVPTREIEEVKLFDNQNDEIPMMDICIDSVLYLLDNLDTLIKRAEKNDGD